MSPSLRAPLSSCLLLTVLGAGCASPWDPSPDELKLLTALTSRKQVKDTSNKKLGDPKAIALGRSLFEDKGLSSCGQVSCASCHPAPGYTVDTAGAKGCTEALTPRNPPTILNTANAEWLMWDGRADSVWSQAVGPILNPIEMAATPAHVRARLTEAHATAYTEVFGGAPADEPDEQRIMANVGKAIAAYEATLVDPSESPFDTEVKRFVALWPEGLGRLQQEPIYLGLSVFMDPRKGGCINCHKGPDLSDESFHSVGARDTSDGAMGRLAAARGLLASPYVVSGRYSDDPKAHGSRLENLAADLDRLEAGTADATLRHAYEGAFRTPTLRNIELTAPYMHTGEYATLEDVVELYNKGGEAKGEYAGEVNPETIHKLELTKEEKAALVELLKKLTAPHPAG